MTSLSHFASLYAILVPMSNYIIYNDLYILNRRKPDKFVGSSDIIAMILAGASLDKALARKVAPWEGEPGHPAPASGLLYNVVRASDLSFCLGTPAPRGTPEAGGLKPGLAPGRLDQGTPTREELPPPPV
jgi:hypothetical protein